MNLYYAFGGGLGHLTRANAFIYTLGFQQDDFLIITSSEHAEMIFKKKQLLIVSEDYYHKPLELKLLIENYINTYKIENLYLDTFPVGISGELNSLKTGNCKTNYVARYLKWENYSPFINNAMIFDNTFVVDYLSDKQLSFISGYSKKQIDLGLRYPPASNHQFVEKVLSQIHGDIWLIVHTGNSQELEMLYKHSIEIANLECVKPGYLVVSQVDTLLKNEHIHSLKYYPAYDFFPFVDRIFTACGFNSMEQTRGYSYKHYFIPFERRFDDQFLRAKQRKAGLRK